MIYHQSKMVNLYLGDTLDVSRNLSSESVDCIVTSPPYFGLRDYGVEGQYGLESSPDDYVGKLSAVFDEARRILRPDGTMWVNLGDSYSGYHGNKVKPNHEAPSNKPGYWENMRKSLPGGIPAKNMIGIPWRLAFELQRRGWILRNDIIWKKNRSSPESVRDRASRKHEHVFLLTKSYKYWFSLDAIREPTSNNGRGRNMGDVWEFNTSSLSIDHQAVMPMELAERCILAGCKPGGVVLDPFSGTGTTGRAALNHGRSYIGIDIKPEYLELSLSSSERLGDIKRPIKLGDKR